MWPAASLILCGTQYRFVIVICFFFCFLCHFLLQWNMLLFAYLVKSVLAHFTRVVSNLLCCWYTFDLSVHLCKRFAPYLTTHTHLTRVDGFTIILKIPYFTIIKRFTVISKYNLLKKNASQLNYNFF